MLNLQHNLFSSENKKKDVKTFVLATLKAGRHPNSGRLPEGYPIFLSFLDHLCNRIDLEKEQDH